MPQMAVEIAQSSVTADKMQLLMVVKHQALCKLIVRKQFQS